MLTKLIIYKGVVEAGNGVLSFIVGVVDEEFERKRDRLCAEFEDFTSRKTNNVDKKDADSFINTSSTNSNSTNTTATPESSPEPELYSPERNVKNTHSTSISPVKGSYKRTRRHKQSESVDDDELEENRGRSRSNSIGISSSRRRSSRSSITRKNFEEKEVKERRQRNRGK